MGVNMKKGILLLGIVILLVLVVNVNGVQPTCGDGVINISLGETCDPGNGGDWSCCDNTCISYIDNSDCGICCSCNNGIPTYNGSQVTEDCVINGYICEDDSADSNPFTLDYQLGLQGTCSSIGVCDYITTSVCNITHCNAECESFNDCEPKIEEDICYFDPSCDSCSCNYTSDVTCPEYELYSKEDICKYDRRCNSEGCKYNIWKGMEDYDNCTAEGPKDVTAPIITDNYEVSGWTNLNQTITLSVTETGGSGLKEVRYCEGDCSLINGIILEEPYQLNYSENINQIIHYAAWDNDSNMGNGSFHIKLDNINPSTMILNTYKWRNDSSSNISVRSEGTGSLSSMLHYVKDDEVNKTIPNSYNYDPFDNFISFQGEGNHTLKYYSVDEAENKDEEKIFSFVIDLSIPLVDVRGDKSSTGSVEIDATTSDNLSGIESYEWTQISGPGTITFSNRYEEDTSVSTNLIGEYELKLTVKDNIGYTNTDSMIYTKTKKSSRGSSRGGPVKNCVEDWECNPWSSCDITQTKTRVCVDNNECGSIIEKPIVEESCRYNLPKLEEEVLPELEEELNVTQFEKNVTNSSNGNQITGGVVREIGGNPLGEFFNSFWDWLRNLFV